MTTSDRFTARIRHAVATILTEHPAAIVPVTLGLSDATAVYIDDQADAA